MTVQNIASVCFSCLGKTLRANAVSFSIPAFVLGILLLSGSHFGCAIRCQETSPPCTTTAELEAALQEGNYEGNGPMHYQRLFYSWTRCQRWENNAATQLASIPYYMAAVRHYPKSGLCFAYVYSEPIAINELLKQLWSNGYADCYLRALVVISPLPREEQKELLRLALAELLDGTLFQDAPGAGHMLAKLAVLVPFQGAREQIWRLCQLGYCPADDYLAVCYRLGYKLSDGEVHAVLQIPWKRGQDSQMFGSQLYWNAREPASVRAILANASPSLRTNYWKSEQEYEKWLRSSYNTGEGAAAFSW